MEDKEHRSTFEELLTSVEQDTTLRSADQPLRADKASEIPAEATAASPEDGGLGGLGALLSNPELISKLPALIKVVQTLTEPTPKGDVQKPATPVALLCALRPYLNDHRRQALDTMIRISRLSESLRSL